MVHTCMQLCRAGEIFQPQAVQQCGNIRAEKRFAECLSIATLQLFSANRFQAYVCCAGIPGQGVKQEDRAIR